MCVAVVPGSMFGCCNQTRFQLVLAQYIEPWSVRLDNDTVQDIFNALDWRYTPWPYLYDNELNREALVSVRHWLG